MRVCEREKEGETEQRGGRKVDEEESEGENK